MWKQYQQGDEQAFALIFRRLYPSLVQFGAKITPRTDLLEDCIQELFTELWQNKSRTEVQSVKAYLLKSLKYKLLRALTRKSLLSVDELTSDYVFELSHESLLITQEENTAQTGKVMKAFAQLSHRQKEIIYLKFYQELDYSEISDIMNINYQVSRNLLYQAIKALKRLITDATLFWLV